MKSLLTCFAATCLSLASSQAIGQAPAQPHAAYMEASAKMEQRIARSAAKGEMPRIEDPETRTLLDVLSDNLRFLESPTYDASNIGQLMDICGQANRLSMAQGEAFSFMGARCVRMTEAVMARIHALPDVAG